MNIILLHFAIKYNGDWDKVFHALEVKEKVSMEEITKLENKSKEWAKEGYNFKTIIDIDYPKQFKECYKPPFVFWYKGDLSVLKLNSISIGSDHNAKLEASQKTNADKGDFLKAEAELLREVGHVQESNKALITPFREASYVHGCNVKAKQIQIVADGIQDLTVAKGNLMISEYCGPMQSLKPVKEKDLASNRLVAALADELVLVSSSKENHSNLVGQFLNLGKEVSCFPKEAASNDFNNELIKQGANLITSLKHFERNKDKGVEREL